MSNLFKQSNTPPIMAKDTALRWCALYINILWAWAFTTWRFVLLLTAETPEKSVERWAFGFNVVLIIGAWAAITVIGVFALAFLLCLIHDACDTYEQTKPVPAILRSNIRYLFVSYVVPVATRPGTPPALIIKAATDGLIMRQFKWLSLRVKTTNNSVDLQELLVCQNFDSTLFLATNFSSLELQEKCWPIRYVKKAKLWAYRSESDVGFTSTKKCKTITFKKD